MQRNNTAQKLPSEKLASASNASENTTLAKAQDKIRILTLNTHATDTRTQHDTTERQEQGRNKRLRAQRTATNGSGHNDITKPQHGTANAGQHSGYSNSSIHTLYTVEILQPANGCRKEEARATTLCMAWHAQQEAPSCATIPTDTGRRGHSLSTTSVAAGGMAMRV
jgi:hypothetical protein